MGKRKEGITLKKRLFVGLIMMAFFLLVGTGIYKVKHDPAVLSYLKQVKLIRFSYLLDPISSCMLVNMENKWNLLWAQAKN